jgi:hypothetical protein
MILRKAIRSLGEEKYSDRETILSSSRRYLAGISGFFQIFRSIEASAA